MICLDCLLSKDPAVIEAIETAIDRALQERGDTDLIALRAAWKGAGAAADRAMDAAFDSGTAEAWEASRAADDAAQLAWSQYYAALQEGPRHGR